MANENKIKALKLYASGLSAQEILDKTHIKRTTGTICKWAREAKINRSPGGSKLKYPHIMELAVNSYKSGDSTREVSDKFSVKIGTVYKWMRDLGINRKREYLHGVQHSNWKNNATVRTRGVRATNEYRKWKLLVLKRDGFKCCGCGQIGGELHAHHILSFKNHPLLRTDINNGITLCRNCHMELHNMLRWVKTA